jgi:hypothetical protein
VQYWRTSRGPSPSSQQKKPRKECEQHGSLVEGMRRDQTKIPIVVTFTGVTGDAGWFSAFPAHRATTHLWSLQLVHGAVQPSPLAVN